MNTIKLIGNIGKNAEIRKVNDKAVVKFSLATNEIFTNKENQEVKNTTWHNVVAWGKMAEECRGLLVKGRFIRIEGKINNRNYRNKENQLVYVTEIIALRVSDVATKIQEN